MDPVDLDPRLLEKGKGAKYTNFWVLRAELLLSFGVCCACAPGATGRG